MKKMKILLVLNPLSRGGKAKKRWEEIFTELRNAGIEWETLLWTSAEEVIRRSVWSDQEQRGPAKRTAVSRVSMPSSRPAETGPSTRWSMV